MADITYSDKDKNSPIDARRRWRDIDANEVKRVINGKEDKFLPIAENEAGVPHPSLPTLRDALLYLLAKTGTATSLNFTFTQSNVTTIGGSNGSITVNAAGGVLPYSYSLNAGAYVSSNVFGNLPAGSYTVRVKDAANATAAKTITITQPAEQAYVAPTGSLSSSKSSVTGNSESFTLNWGIAQNSSTSLANIKIQVRTTGAYSDLFTGLNGTGGTTNSISINEVSTFRLTFTDSTNVVRYSNEVTVTFATPPPALTFNRTLQMGSVENADGVYLAAEGGLQFKFNAEAPVSDPTPYQISLYFGGTQVGVVDYNVAYNGDACQIIYNGQTFNKTFVNGNLTINA